MTTVSLPDDIDFALCLTHDVDRPYKTYQALYFATQEKPLYHLYTLISNERPYWQFETIAQIEADLGVRSAFYWLNEPSQFEVGSLTDLFSLKNLTNHLGRYDIGAPELAATIRQLDEAGWEVGLHGSSTSYRDERRLQTEKNKLQSVVGHSIAGIRQHYLHLDVPQTWQYQSNVGLNYDTTLGSSTEYGFNHGHLPKRPFNDDFVVFPLTLMEVALPDPGNHFADAWAACEQLLEEAAENSAVMTVLWHPRYFNDDEFPGYRQLYERLISEALDQGAWVGPPGDLYELLID